ncbi:hypothetical protein GH733_001341 [Mirounga leonina]|nr:hypothetical protein GH733_001341 [Mirounga leonina]
MMIKWEYGKSLQEIRPAGAARPVAGDCHGGHQALVLAIHVYTFYSVSQERFLDELEDEAKAAQAQALARASGP